MVSEAKRPGEPTAKEYAKVVAEIVEKLQRVGDAYLREFDEHKAFDYLTAEAFETTSEEGFVFTDGARDGGVDFYVKDLASYTVYQCKCPDLENITSGHSPVTFNDEGVNDLVAAVEMLLDETGDYEISKQVKRLRTDFQRDSKSSPDETSLTAKLAVLGELTPAAASKFRAAQKQMKAKGVSLQLIEWREIYSALHFPEDIAQDMEFDLGFQLRDKDVLRHNDYCYVLANAPLPEVLLDLC